MELNPLAGHLPENNPEPLLEKNTRQYSIIKGKRKIKVFNSFYEAYMYGLNRFCSQDFLVQREGE